MTQPNPDTDEVLCGEILAEGRRKCEEILRGAREQGEALLARAQAEASRVRQARLAAGQAEAARRSDLILATVPVEAGRLRTLRLESILEAVRLEIRRRLLDRSGYDYREALVALAVEALGAMEGNAFVLKLSPADHAAVGVSLPAEIRRRVARSRLELVTVEEPAITEGGLIVEDAEGRQIWDNRLGSRLERLWPELRRQMAVAASLVPEPGQKGGGA